MLVNILSWACLLILIYMVGLNFFHSIMILIATRAVPYYNKEYFLRKGVFLPDEFKEPFSILVPLFNEEKTILDSVEAFLSVNYHEYEVILVNDGSTDKTLEILKEKFQLTAVAIEPDIIYESKPVKNIYYSRVAPKLVVIDKENGGKADTQNAAANIARYRYFCVLDADTLPDQEILNKIAFKLSSNPDVAALGGTVRVVNDCKIENGIVADILLPRRFLGRVQVVEYLRAFLFGRIGLANINALMIISGAFGVFRRAALEAIHGWNRNAIAEDMDAVVRLHRHIKEKNRPWRILFIPDSVAWTQVPATMEYLSIQRERWQRGLMQVLLKNIGMFLNGKYGRVGIVGFPYFFIFEMISAVIEFACYPMTILCFIFGVIDFKFFLYFFILTFFLGLLHFFNVCDASREELPSLSRHAGFLAAYHYLFF